MAEHGVDEKVLAFVWDGTGYGTDGTVWGGEVLLADTEGFERVARLRPFRLLGGEKAVREPRRVALALLFELYGIDAVLALENPAVEAFSPDEIRLLHRAWEKGLNAPVTTSMGRLFDAVASLTGLCQKVGYEGESGLLLENAACSGMGHEAWSMEREKGLLRLVGEEGGLVIDWEPLVRWLAQTPRAEGAAVFDGAVADAAAEIAAKYPGLSVGLSGGVFENRTLCEAVLPKLSARRVLLPRHTPVNDGTIALGQAWYALHAQTTSRSIR
jgi:hydrogenase maturation protein HypF